MRRCLAAASGRRVAAVIGSFHAAALLSGSAAEDAVDTFERSGLPHLALDRWLISKK